MPHSNMRVTLGASSLKAYVTAPRTLHVIGIVRLGMEYGLLATNADGVFFRVNGSSMVELDARRVQEAIEIAYRNGVRHGLGPVEEAPKPAPVVTVRKRRHSAFAELT